MPSNPTHVIAMAILPSFPWLNNVLICLNVIYINFLSIHWWHIGYFKPWLLWTNISSISCFHPLGYISIIKTAESHVNSGVSLVAQMVKNPPAVEETQVHSSGQEDPLEKRMAAHSSILSWWIPWTKEPDGLQFMGLQSQTQLIDEHTYTVILLIIFWGTSILFFIVSYIPTNSE